ncbi:MULTISPECIES: sugar transferase [unclassified Streptomyces]|uniref:sugar transferase n=1 Tax=unclassified Streptomyces TaxID=2593676 RepID=UPI0001C1A7C4|nr:MULTISPECIES: sugar transferase [unclassified Streptomyces]AEN10966.1 sugar transferase [Streptomyces sp. SirexAA-E]MYR66001.1 sugar transferase [Streptomyces sp. SID4939]MYR98990.1 sugar transferase [Streptomyces sp. SID4940]MYT63765.1 sugar transferase [Streptomyces sp. SID8357]MYT86015.1 sugar transferase [Streptomyces sp. SID8360]
MKRAVRGTWRPAAPGAARAPLREALSAAADALADRAAAVTAKRALDLGLGSALLLLAAPALALAALVLAVRRGGDGEGVVRREPRVGLGGRPFELRSLRTRRFRLDLLSRLPHVVRGELSLVGPPPPHPDDPALRDPLTDPWWQELRPGLTGLAQVRARSRMPWDEPALLDAHYAEHHGTGLDLAILARTAHIQLRTSLRGARRGKASLSDTDHRLPGCSRVD